MANDKLTSLIALLKQKTELGDVDWGETERPGVFQVSFPKYTVRLSRKMAPSNSYDYVISIIDMEGDIVEEVDDTDFPDDNMYHLMGELYEMARRKVKGVDEAIDDILKSLNEFDDLF